MMSVNVRPESLQKTLCDIKKLAAHNGLFLDYVWLHLLYTVYDVAEYVYGHLFLVS